ncbi:hypothetical protein QQF64_032438 [Cirrhinus molitorella]|uniref:Uncharacterized protein n=1 Tax=Cirrhinus molitorella TaxID=172907 RepID=A0ABR3MZU9_9TELE
MPAGGGTGDGGPPGLKLKNEASEADLCRLSPNKQASDPGPQPEGSPATQTAISPSPSEPSREANGHTPSDRKTERAKPAGHMCLVVRGTQTTDCPTQKCCSCPAFPHGRINGALSVKRGEKVTTKERQDFSTRQM